MARGSSTLMRFFAPLLLFGLALLSSGCFKSDEEKAVERVHDFIKHFNYKSPGSLLVIAQKASEAAKNLAPQFSLSTNYRDYATKINNVQEFRQRYAVIRRTLSSLSVKGKAPRISSQGENFLVKTAIEIKSTGSNAPSTGELFYQFVLQKIKGKWLIVKGEDEQIFE